MMDAILSRAVYFIAGLALVALGGVLALGAAYWWMVRVLR